MSGFASAWEFDESRTYRTEFDNGSTYGAEKSPRPVLVLQWYPTGDRHGLNTDGFTGSAGDVEFLIGWARTRSVADVGRVGLIGHSAGAQAMLPFAAQPQSRCDALVLLDTTQDYSR